MNIFPFFGRREKLLGYATAIPTGALGFVKSLYICLGQLLPTILSQQYECTEAMLCMLLPKVLYIEDILEYNKYVLHYIIRCNVHSLLSM